MGASPSPVGQVDARGKGVLELQNLIAGRLKKYISDPVVTVSLQQIEGNMVYVIGQVTKPGNFVVNPDVNVMQALSMAGGTTAFASLNSIIVLRSTATGGQIAIPFHYNDVAHGMPAAERAAPGRGRRGRAVSSPARGARRARRRADERGCRPQRHLPVPAAASAAATDYEFNPWAELGAGYDNNILIASSGVRPDRRGRRPGRRTSRPAGAGIELEVGSHARSAGHLVSKRVRIRFQRGVTDSERTAQRSTLHAQLGCVWLVQSLLTGYLPTTAVGTGLGQSEPGRRRPLASIRQNLGTLTPSYTLQMTPRSTLQLNASYTDASYSSSLPAYVEYKNATGSAGLALGESPTSSLVLRATGADFRPDTGRTADTYGAEGEWDGKYSETKQYYLRIGLERTDFSGTVAGSPLRLVAPRAGRLAQGHTGSTP